MKFLFEHDVPDDLAYCLEALGHEVLKLRQLSSTTIADEEVLRLANEQRCILLTCNRDDFRTPDIGGAENVRFLH